jgi:hypothetical protein
MLAGIERELDPPRAARVFGGGYFNLLRRGADGSLVLSADRWRLHSLTAEAFRFTAQADQVEPLVVPVDHVQRVVWDRLPRQRVRSQIRLYLCGGDVWTFSGSVDESALPDG